MKSDRKRQTVLIVDDDCQVVEMLRTALEMAGFSVTTAADGVTALKSTRSLLPDLVLLDLVIPEMDGFSVCETLRRDRATASIPIIMLTGLSSELNRYAGLESGADDYLAKPLNISQLTASIHRLLGESAQASGKTKAPNFPIGNSTAQDGRGA